MQTPNKIIKKVRSDLLKIVRTSWVETSAQFPCIFGIESPIAQSTRKDFGLRIQGWIIGKQIAARSIEIRFGDLLLAKIDIETPKPGVAQKYPNLPKSDRSGFQITLSTIGMPTQFQLQLFVVLENSQRLYLGSIEVCSLHYYRHFYFVNHNHKFIYCSIPKNACTLFKRFTLEYSGDTEFQNHKDIHYYIAKHKTPIAMTDMSLLNNPEYYKFTILRDPLERLVSAYLDKFVRWLPNIQETFALQVIKEVYESQGLEPDYSKSITFSQFVHYVSTTNDILLDQHWKPQHLFLSDTKFDYIGKFEQLDEVIQHLEQKFNLTVNRKVSKHQTNYNRNLDELDYQDLYGEELKKRKLNPTAQNLYTPELKELVESKYELDLQIYKSL
ncbi:MAG TPA: sulfotransferase family protein [Oscillatoriales cyanobacterium M59_W2019_021]|nr:sulfotransferase family protein [Oscillatoriales cyanobacterium M4454_W2019_049]HIK50941.1 sulfotransferase family protein [Oscillatoriales cyanobacterium M59_W2019_021]